MQQDFGFSRWEGQSSSDNTAGHSVPMETVPCEWLPKEVSGCSTEGTEDRVCVCVCVCVCMLKGADVKWLTR